MQKKLRRWEGRKSCNLVNRKIRKLIQKKSYVKIKAKLKKKKEVKENQNECKI